MSELLRAINNLNNREYGPEDIQELRRALTNGEIKITMDGHLTVGDIAPSMGAATIPGIQSSFNISVPPEVIQELLNARPSTPLQLPPRAIHFRGRGSELNNLLNQLRLGETYTLVGPGGIGKSALALEVAYDNLRRYRELPAKERFKAIIWTTAQRYRLTGEGVLLVTSHCELLRIFIPLLLPHLDVKTLCRSPMTNRMILVRGKP